MWIIISVLQVKALGYRGVRRAQPPTLWQQGDLNPTSCLRTLYAQPPFTQHCLQVLATFLLQEF